MIVVAMSFFRFLFIAFAALAAVAAAAEADPCLKEDYAEANCAPRRRTTPILRAARAHGRATIHNHAARPRHRPLNRRAIAPPQTASAARRAATRRRATATSAKLSGRR